MSLTLTLFAIFGQAICFSSDGTTGRRKLRASFDRFYINRCIALLGIIAVVLVGHEITDLGNLVSKKFPSILFLSTYWSIICTAENRKCII